jgi:TrkA family protein
LRTGKHGRFVLAELQKTCTPCAVIDLSEENVRKMQELDVEALREMFYVIGDATEEETLEKCGLSRAKGLVAALPDDKDNMVITVLVRQALPAAADRRPFHRPQVRRPNDEGWGPMPLSHRAGSAACAWPAKPSGRM